MSFARKTALVNLRMPPSLKAAAQRAAADDRRSLTSLIEKLLVEYLRSNSSPAQESARPRDAEQPPGQVRAHPARSLDGRGAPVSVGRLSGAVARVAGDRPYGRSY
jgi:hypothetical protein